MKKILLMTTLFFAMIAISNAQDNTLDSREKFQIGGKVGVSISNVYDAQGEEFDADPRVGFTGGFFVAIPIGKYLGVQPEILITQKGFKGSGTMLGGVYSFKRITTFLEVPIFLALKPIEFVTLFAGPQYSFLLKQRDVFTSALINSNQEQEFEQDNIRKNILGFVIGADINIQNFVLSGRMGWDFLKNKGNGESNTPRYKNICGQVSIGYRL